ncbi:flagellar protein FlbB [Treponema sp.]|uniref:periplasmic-type flagellar collar protein FlbB n=1 Tax=Treponema sp. TaxID=166 RepID=UPI0025D58CC9|nr:flagellar protein FlbB [Treponema sp.]MCR5217502.1 flagellar protein FlbB [Treponema sp.]
MGAKKSLLKSLLLIILIIILSLFGILWFDILNVINAKSFFAPLYKLIGLAPQTSRTVTDLDDIEIFDKDEDILKKRMQSISIQKEELDKRAQSISEQEEANLLVAQELEDERLAFEEEKKTFNNRVKKYDDKYIRIEQLVSQLNSMAPKNAVAILVDMCKTDKQYVVDILRTADEIAQRDGTASNTSYWLSLMPVDVSGELGKLLVVKPVSLD